MTASFINAGSINGNIGTTATAALPGSRTTGDLLIAFVNIISGSKSISIGGGWTIPPNGDATDANQSSAFAYRIVDGTEAAPSFTWSGAEVWHCKVEHYTGNDSAIGAVTKNSGSGTTLSVGALTTTADNSLAAALLLCLGDTVIPTPSGFTSRSAFDDGNASDILADKTVATSGSSSGSPSVTINSAAWSGFLIEILATPPPPTPPASTAACVLMGL